MIAFMYGAKAQINLFILIPGLKARAIQKTGVIYASLRLELSRSELPRPLGRGKKNIKTQALALHYSKSIFFYKLIMFFLEGFLFMMIFLFFNIVPYPVYS